jgi:hypothetical protein
MISPIHELTPRQVRAIEAIVTGSTQAEAAAAASISLRQLRRWLQRDHVIREMRRQRSAASDAAMTVLAAGAADAARRLLDLSRAGSNADSVRLTACRAVLDFVSRHQENVETVRRIEDLEAALAAPKKPEVFQ